MSFVGSLVARRRSDRIWRQPVIGSRLAAWLRQTRRGVVIVGALCLLFVAIVFAAADPFTTHNDESSTLDNGAATGIATVQHRTLTAQQTLVGTVGYAGAWTVVVPAGPSVGDAQQAEQQVAVARAAAVTARVTLASDAAALAAASGAALAARLKETRDCAGANSAIPIAAANSPATAPAASGQNPCQSSVQAAETSQETLDSVNGNVIADRAQLASARATLNSAERALDVIHSASTSYGSSASFTSLPSIGTIVGRGEALYAIDGNDTILLYGAIPAWRSFAVGMSSGTDVAELNANLRALGYDSIMGDEFTSATRQAVEAMQEAHGVAPTGALALGSVVFEPGAARVTGVTPAVGQSVQAGPIMTLSSTRHTVSVQLSAAQQSQVKVGNRVLITLPNDKTTPGVVDFVGKVATSAGPSQSPGSTGGSSAPALPVTVRFVRPAAAGTLDQAPVNVMVTTASVRDALVVPVSALVALAGGGYALEVVSSGVHRLVAVTPGLFDDAEGLVQVEGSGIRPGQRVVVPASS